MRTPSDPSLSRRAALGALAGVAAGTLGAPAQAVAPRPGLPAMRRGLNLSHWFEYERGQAVSLEELRALKALGLDHVRLPIDPFVGAWNPSARPRLSFQGELDSALFRILEAGLEVVVDIHMPQEHKETIERRPELERALGDLWRHLAGIYASLPVDRVAFELLNEPQYYSWRAWRWPGVQRDLLAAVRERAPHHLVLLTGNEGGSFKGLTHIEPVPDPRTAYVFHHYEPFLFTHQGAAWLEERYTTAGLRGNLRYPVSAQAGHTPTLAKAHPRAQAELQDYLDGGWNAARLRSVIDEAGAWSRRHGVRVVCNEFGVFRDKVDPASRYGWLHDVRVALEANDIGWSVWDYTDIFGLTAQSAQPDRFGARQLEDGALQALGLARAASSGGRS